MTTRRRAKVFIGAAACAGLLASGVSARALTETARASAAQCRLISDAEFTKVSTVRKRPAVSTTGTIKSNSRKYRPKILCAVENNVVVPAQDMTWAHVHLRDSSLAQHAFAVSCVKFRDLLGGSCGDGATNGPNSVRGVTMVDVTTNWPADADAGFPYLYVELPVLAPIARDEYIASLLYGFSSGTD